MLKKVQCVDCSYLFDISMDGYKKRIYTCPNCISNEHKILSLKDMREIQWEIAKSMQIATNKRK